MELTAANVDEVIKDCFYAEGSVTKETLPNDAIIAKGVVRTYVFDPVKIAKHKEAIASMLGALPPEFRESVGGGYSFVEGCRTNVGGQWTGVHASIEALFCLGTAARLGAWLPSEDR